jgi:mRNA interferase HigB
MRVISNRALTDFASLNPLATVPLQAWRKVVESKAFAHFAEVKDTFNAVDRAGQYYVFDIGGNKYRIIAAIHFDQQKLFVRHVFTHKEYDKWKP